MLFWREFQKTIVGIPYILFVAVIVIALNSQGVLDFRSELVAEPTPSGSQNYGTKNEEIPERIMPAALASLYAEFQANRYQTYPIGLIKYVKLDEDRQQRIAEILSEISGVNAEELYASQDVSNNSHIENSNTIVIGENTTDAPGSNGSFTITAENGFIENSPQIEPDLCVRADISYAEFKVLMQTADDILGGGSHYASESLIRYGRVPVTYEEAVKRYELVQTYDQFTGGYARLFSDYAAAMALSILPVFPAVIMSMRDRRAKMSELIYIRKTSGAKIIFVRYLAVTFAVMLPVLLLSYCSNISMWHLYPGEKLDYLAPLKYTLGWLMPSAMIVAAVSMCLTELTNTPIAVLVCGLWWFIDTNQGIRSVSASYSLLRLAPRHNAGALSYFRTQDFADNLPRLFANRLLFAGVSVVIVLVTIVIYEAKRRGKLTWKK
ncbi:MAG: hypothetical protein K2O40_06770 [Lachnospiraceae bacterium]|nr:hypothetical protein [Lachnospiraceae bacterium]